MKDIAKWVIVEKIISPVVTAGSFVLLIAGWLLYQILKMPGICFRR